MIKRWLDLDALNWLPEYHVYFDRLLRKQFTSTINVSTTGHISNTGNCGCTSPYYWRSWSAARTGSNSWSPGNCRENVVPIVLRCHQLQFLVSLRHIRSSWTTAPIPPNQKYSHSFLCSKCDRLWKHIGMLHRHERTCTGDVIYKYPGGVYHTTQTVFDRAEQLLQYHQIIQRHNLEVCRGHSLVVIRLGWNFYVGHWSSTMYGQASEKA
jgi:hypothetical protein